MDQFWLNFGVSAVLTILQTVIKNPQSKEQYKRVMLKIYNTIKLAFAGDPDFQ